EPLFHKSADLVRKVVQLKPSMLKDDEQFGHFAPAALFNDACAFEREKKIPEALASLREAVALGFSNIELLETSDELAKVQSAPEFADFLTEAREKVKAA